MAALCYLICLGAKPGTYMWGKNECYQVSPRAYNTAW